MRSSNYEMGLLRGFEPPNDGVTVHCLNHLTTVTSSIGITTGVPSLSQDESL